MRSGDCIFILENLRFLGIHLQEHSRAEFRGHVRVRDEQSPARGQQGRHYRSSPESAKEECQCLRDTGRRSATESASTRASAKGR